MNTQTVLAVAHLYVKVSTSHSLRTVILIHVLADNICCQNRYGNLASEYRGVMAKTKVGQMCQKWTSQEPHAHTNTPENKPEDGLGDHNYCRNPDPEGKEEGAWCYTTDPLVEWEYCSCSK